MKIAKRYLLPPLLALALAGCAQQPGSIVAADVSSRAYVQSSCSQLVTRQNTIERQLAGLTEAQRREANRDAAWVAGGAILFFPVMAVAATGPDYTSEISEKKGELNAIEEALLVKSC